MAWTWLLKNRGIRFVAGTAIFAACVGCAPAAYATSIAGDQISAHGVQFALPEGVEGYDGFLREKWGGQSDGSPLTLEVLVTQTGDSPNSLTALGDGVSSEVSYREWTGQRLLKSTMKYTNEGGLAFEVYFFFDESDDVMYAWAPIPMADGSRVEFEISCPFDDFVAQMPTIDAFFGGICLDEATGKFELIEATEPVTERTWFGTAGAVPEGVQDPRGETGGLHSGIYTAAGKGIGGDVPVTVVVKNGKIASVTVGDNCETQGIGSKAIEQLPEAIVAANGTEGVDGVSGATITSKAIFTAVDDCVAQAASSEVAQDAETDARIVEDERAFADKKADDKAAANKAAAGLKDGTYEAEGKGIGGDVPVTVVVKGGKIASVAVGDNSETQGIGSNAIEQLPEAIVAANGIEGVEGVSGATITSKAIFTAVDDCLAQASA